MDSQRSTVCRTSRVGWDAARCRGSQPRLSDSLKAKVCLSISLRVQTSPGHHGNRSNSRRKDGGKTFKNRNSQDSQEQRQPSEGFMTSFTSSLSSLHLSPTSLFIYLPLSLCLSGCQPPDAWQSSSTAAGLVTFQTRASGPNTNASLCNGKGIFLCDVQPTLLDGSQDSQVFIRRCC